MGRWIWPDRRWIGAAFGVVLGLSITLILYQRNNATELSVDQSGGLNRAPDRTRMSQDGVRTLGVDDSVALD